MNWIYLLDVRGVNIKRLTMIELLPTGTRWNVLSVIALVKALCQIGNITDLLKNEDKETCTLL